MALSREKLLHQLDQEELVDWAPELKNGKEAYEFLTTVLGKGTLSVNQTRNGLHALFRIRTHGNNTEVLRRFLELATHPDLEIRSKAVQLAIGLVRYTLMTDVVGVSPIMLSEDQREVLRNALAAGLTPRVTEIAREFLE